LETQLNVKLADAEKTIAATKTAAMTNIEAVAVETAIAIVERLIGTAPTAQTAQDAVAGVLKR
jgi:F-type H+-transporting ATPase subunit b